MRRVADTISGLQTALAKTQDALATTLGEKASLRQVFLEAWAERDEFEKERDDVIEKLNDVRDALAVAIRLDRLREKRDLPPIVYYTADKHGIPTTNDERFGMSAP